jgi:hypothetical protein
MHAMLQATKVASVCGDLYHCYHQHLMLRVLLEDVLLGKEAEHKGVLAVGKPIQNKAQA